MELQRKELDRVWGSEFGVDAMLHGRQRSIRNNAIVKAVSSLGVGVGGLLTAVTPFGYAVLLPFAVGRAGSEYFSQKKLGYTRKAFLQQREDLSRRSLVNELIYCSQTHQLLKDIKRRTRQRYAWGAHAPVPFRLGFQAANWLRARRHPTPEAPAAQVRAALLGYYHIRWEWLRRRQSTVLRNKTRLYAAGCGFHDAFAATQHAHLDQALHHLRRQADCAMDECEAMREQEVASMLGRDAAVWVRRIVQFFVACDLFPLLVAALYKNATLAAALPPMEPNARGSSTRLVVEAERLLADLHGQHAELLHDPAFLLAFYACVEKVLLGDVKQHFQELRREVMDMITTRLWLKEHPLPPPRLRRTAPVLLPALEPA